MKFKFFDFEIRFSWSWNGVKERSVFQTFNSILQLAYALYLYLTAQQLLAHGNGLMEHWDQFRAHPEQALQASCTLLSQTVSGLYFLWIVFRSWQYARTRLHLLEQLGKEERPRMLTYKQD